MADTSSNEREHKGKRPFLDEDAGLTSQVTAADNAESPTKRLDIGSEKHEAISESDMNNLEWKYRTFVRNFKSRTGIRSPGGTSHEQPADLTLIQASNPRFFYGQFLTGKFDDIITEATKINISGTFILSKLIVDHLLGWITYAVESHFESIATVPYEWIQDLKEAGCSAQEIAQSLIESALEGPWVPFYQGLGDLQHITKDQIVLDFHLPYCPHSDNLNRLIIERGEASEFNNSTQSFLNSDQAERGQILVAEYCGLGGIFPAGHPQLICGLAKFDDGAVEVTYGSVELDINVDLEPIPRQPIQQILLSSQGILKAISVLQSMELCCDRITYLRKEKGGEIRMASISFKKIFVFFQALEKLDAEPLENVQDLSECADLALELLENLLPELTISDESLAQNSEVVEEMESLTEQLEIYGYIHKCSILTQTLSFMVLSYSQAHTGELWPPLIREPLTNILLLGFSQDPRPKSKVIIKYQQLGCMGDMLGGSVLVFQRLNEAYSRSEHSDLDIPVTSISASNQNKAFLIACIEDIIDSWGPGLLLSELGSSYGEAVSSVMIAGGTIAPVVETQTSVYQTLHHWGRNYLAPENGVKCSITDNLVIGAVTTHATCPVNIEDCWKASGPYFDKLGTQSEYWKLVERQVMLQGGQYVAIQLGNVYQKVPGRSLKNKILDSWAMIQDFNVLLQPWGLQISLCTRIARRVVLKTLIEEPMFAYVDLLGFVHWDTIKTDMRLAFRDEIDFTTWWKSLRGGHRECAIKVVTFFLETLKDTGLDQEGKFLRILWPHRSDLCHSVSLRCKGSNLWARILKDSPSCATFAAITDICLEAPGHICKKNTSPIWTGQGTLLSTAVNRFSFGAKSDIESAHWELRNGQQCWIDRPGGQVWVYITKNPNSDTQLKVKINRLPKGLSLFRGWQVLRERQNPVFEAEEVLVLA